jgi:hypothetical protein
MLGDLGDSNALTRLREDEKRCLLPVYHRRMESNPSLELLELSPLSTATDRLTWAPDYSDIIRPGDVIGQPESATCGLSTVFELSHDECVLFAGGVYIDQIKARSTLRQWHPTTESITTRDSPIMVLEEGYTQTLQAFRDWERVMIEHGLINRYNGF